MEVVCYVVFFANKRLSNGSLIPAEDTLVRLKFCRLKRFLFSNHLKIHLPRVI